MLNQHKSNNIIEIKSNYSYCVPFLCSVPFKLIKYYLELFFHVPKGYWSSAFFKRDFLLYIILMLDSEWLAKDSFCSTLGVFCITCIIFSLKHYYQFTSAAICEQNSPCVHFVSYKYKFNFCFKILLYLYVLFCFILKWHQIVTYP